MSIYDHFRDEERFLVERIMEWVETVRVRYQIKLTAFLDPREQFIVQSLIGREADVQVSFFGGYKDAERKRACIYPDFFEISMADYELSLVSLVQQQKNISFEHRDVLGSLLGLGVKREKFGDILLTEQNVQVIMADEITEFVEFSLRKINRYPVHCQAISWDKLIVPEEEWLYRQTTLSSFRLDLMLAELLNISRSRALPLIKAGKVRVNWKLIDQPSFIVQEKDQLSVKGHGRFLFARVEGETRKQKYRVILGRKT